jgi:hypothetical protein
VNKRLWSQRYRPRGNFASQIHEVYKSLGDFGTGGIFSEEIPGEGLIYKACNLERPLHRHEDLYGRVTYMPLQVRDDRGAGGAALRRRPAAGPDQDQARPPGPTTRRRTSIASARTIIAMIGSPGVAGMAFESWWVCKDARQVVGKGGFRTFPYAVSRYVMRSGEVYGRSPAMMALADILMLNTMSQTIDPGSAAFDGAAAAGPHDGVMSALGDGISLEPFAINWGGVDPATGNPLVHPLNRGSQFRPLKDEIRDRRQSINAAFLVTLFQILVDTPQMTATEAMLRAQEKGALLAPVAERQQSELLGPIIERELDLLGRSGAFTPMPDALAQSRDGMKVEYDNPMKQAMMASQGVGLVRTIEALTPLAAVDKSVLDVFNPDEIGPGLAEINGVPSKWIRTKDEITAIRQGRQQQVDLEQLVNAAPQVTGAIKNMADVQNSAGTPRF